MLNRLTELMASGSSSACPPSIHRPQCGDQSSLGRQNADLPRSTSDDGPVSPVSPISPEPPKKGSLQIATCWNLDARSTVFQSSEGSELRSFEVIYRAEIEIRYISVWCSDV